MNDRADSQTPIVEQVVAMAECSRDIIAMTDSAFRPTYINAAARSFFGLSEETPARTLDLYVGVDPAIREELRHEARTALMTHGNWRTEYTLTAPHTGVQRTVAATYISLSSPTGKRLGFAFICRDLDESADDGNASTTDFVMNQALVEQTVLEDELMRAVAENEFELYFQPVVNTVDRRIRGQEALLRWNHPTRGVVAPGDFLPAVQSAGLTGAVGQWTIQAAAQAVAKFEAAGCATSIGVNLFSAQLVAPELIATLHSAASAAQVDVRRLVIEVSENTLMDDIRAAGPVFADLHANGITVAIDDFGTGYSNLSRLRDLDVGCIKIDRSLVIDIDRDPRARQLFSAVMGIAEALDVFALAEGVETNEQLDVAASLGCPFVQGFYTGRPQQLDRAIALSCAQG